jgi:hypothetical protein
MVVVYIPVFKIAVYTTAIVWSKRMENSTKKPECQKDIPA